MSRDNNKFQKDTRITKDSEVKTFTSNSTVMGGALRNATSIPFNVASGMRAPTQGDEYGTDSEPQMIRIQYQPTLGIATSVDSPAYRAAREAFQVINVNNGRIPPYDSSLVQLYFIAAGNMDIALTWAKRIYHMTLTYKEENRSIPEMFFEAEGLDWNAFRQGLQNYRTNLDLLIKQFNSVLRVPAGMEFIARQKRLIEKSYTDEETSKSQIFHFCPVTFYKWDEGSIDPATSEAIPTRLIPVPIWYHLSSDHFDFDPFGIKQNPTNIDESHTAIWTANSSKYGPDDVIALLNDMLRPLLGSQDVAILIADLINAGVSMETVDYVEADKEYEISKDDGMINMIENARIVPQATQQYFISGANRRTPGGVYFPVMTVNNDINAGNVEFTYYGGSPFQGIGSSTFPTGLSTWRKRELRAYTEGKMINMHIDNPSPEDQYAATRWVPRIRPSSINQGCIDVVSCSTEIIVDMTIYWARYSNLDPAFPSKRRIVWLHLPPFLVSEDLGDEGYGGYSQTDQRVLAYLSSFHRHPELLGLNYDYDQSTLLDLGHPSAVMRYWEMDKWAMFQDYVLDRCHNLNILLAFNTSANKSNK